MNVFWPTHKVKARDRRNKALALKKRNRKIRRLTASGKRGDSAWAVN